MSTLISGHLIDGAGIPVPNCRIELISKKTSPTVIVHVVACCVTDADGGYAIKAEPGYYRVRLCRDTRPPAEAGEIYVTPTDSPDTLNAFLDAPKDGDLRPEVMKRFEEMVNEVIRLAEQVNHDKDAAKGAATAAAASEQAAHQHATQSAQGAESSAASKKAAERAAAAAAASERAAQQHEQQASQHATQSAQGAESSAASKKAAEESATAAAASERAAQQHEQQASQHATQSAQGAESSAVSQKAAEEAATAAAASERAAQQHEQQASQHATQSAQGAESSAVSQKAAEEAATAASASERAAQQYEQQASQHAAQTARDAQAAELAKQAATASAEQAGQHAETAKAEADRAAGVVDGALQVENCLSEIAAAGEAAQLAARTSLALGDASTLGIQANIYDRTPHRTALPGAFGYGALYESAKSFSADSGLDELLAWLPYAYPGRYFVEQGSTNGRQPIISGVLFRGELEVALLDNDANTSNLRYKDRSLRFFGVNGEIFVSRFRTSSSGNYLVGWENLKLTPLDVCKILRSSVSSQCGHPDVGGLVIAAYLGASDDDDHRVLIRGRGIPGSRLGMVSIQAYCTPGQSHGSTPTVVVEARSAYSLPGSYAALSGSPFEFVSTNQALIGLFMRIF